MDIVERLRGVPLFNGVSDFFLSRVAETAEERLVTPDTIVSRQAELGATFFVIDSGEAVIYHVDPQGFRRPVGVLRAGDSYGVTSLFLGEPRDATVQAKTVIRLWAIQRPAFQDLLLNYPGLRDELRIPEKVHQKLRAPRYPWLQPGEVVVYHSRRHWIVFASKMLLATFLILVYVAVLIWLFLTDTTTVTWATILLLPVLMIYLGYLIWEWVDWQNDYFAVTTHRVTHREQVAFIYESRHEVPIEQVQNTIVILGFVGSLLHFGDLTVTSAARSEMVLTTVPNPHEFQNAINDQIDRMRALRRAVQRRLIRQDLAAHMNLQMPETTPEAPPGAEGPVVYHDLPVIARQPWLVRLMRWLATVGAIPRTRVEENNTITWRKHWIFLLRRLLLPTAVILVSGTITLLGVLGIPASLVAFVPYYPLLTLVSALIGVGWYWWDLTDWSNDLYTVTPDRIIDTEKRPLFFSEQRREANLGMIQDVNLRIPDPVASLFNYGDVIIKTAGAGGDFTFEDVGNPRDVQREVFARMTQYKARVQEQEEARRRREMAEWFSVFDELQRTRDVSRVEPGTRQSGPDTGQGSPTSQDSSTL